ncbi:MAG: MFS transporter [Marinobacter sp.]
MVNLHLLMPIRSILWSVALLLLGNGLINTLITLQGARAGFPSLVLGAIMSAYFVGFICGTWVSGRLIRRMGHIRTFAFCASLCATSALVHALLVDPWFWLVLRFIYGLSYITLITVIESWLNSQSARHERGRIFAVYMVVNLGALALAQQVLRLDTGEPFVLFALVTLFICWAMLPITLTSRPQPTLPERPGSKLRTLLTMAPLPVAAALLSGLAMGAFWAMTPVYVSALGYGAAEVGMVMSLAIVGGAVLQIPIGRYSDSHDRPWVLLQVIVAATVVALLIPLAVTRELLFVAFALWGGLAFALYPLAVAQLIDQLSASEVVSGSSDMLVLHGAGCALAPVLAGALMSLAGPQGLPLYIACVLALLAGYVVLRRRHVSDLVTGESAHFEPMVQTGGEVLQMMFDETQPDLFDDPGFYDEAELDRLGGVYRQKSGDWGAP